MAEIAGNLESVLVQANAREKEYDWLGAASLYRKALDLFPEKVIKMVGGVGESLAYALFKASFQSDSAKVFKSRMVEASAAYQSALENSREVPSPAAVFLVRRCEAMLSFTNFWLASNQQDRRRLVAEVWSRIDEALKCGEASGISHEHCETFRRLAVGSALAFYFEEDFECRKGILERVIGYGENAINLLQSEEDSSLLASIYTIVTASLIQLYTFIDSDHIRAFDERVERYWGKVLGFPEQQWILEFPYFALVGGTPASVNADKETSLLQKALESCRRTGDKLSIGCVLERLASTAAETAWGAEDSDARLHAYDEYLRYAREAGEAFSSISHVSPIPWGDSFVGVPEAGYYANLALFESDLGKKRDYAERGLSFVREALRQALESGYPEVIMIARDVMDHVLIALAETETDPERKARLLEEAIDQRTKSLEIHERYSPYNEWGRGWWQGALGHAKLELARLTQDPHLKEDLLKEGIRLEEHSVELTSKPSRGGYSGPARVNLIELWRHRSVEGLSSLFDLTGRTEYLEKAVESTEAAFESYRKFNMHSRMAECSWKAASFLDKLRRYIDSSEKFRLASDCFKTAADNLPRLRAFYTDYSQYMLAWERIERATYYHARQEYAQASESYREAAEGHKSTTRWSFLSTNYFAWAQFEHAEDLSLMEKSRDSMESFKETARLFRDSEKTISEHTVSLDNTEETQMVKRLAEVSDYIQKFCKARIALEEARSLDKEGDLGDASEKYGSAADMFLKISYGLAADQNRNEINLIATLSRAWKAMAKAEAESSSGFYEEAAHLFDDARNLSLGDKAKNMAMGHSRLCMALAAGLRYADTSDSALHMSATQNLDSAAKYYLKADLGNAAEFAKACKHLFDGYAFMNKASTEDDQEKKTKLYAMAEKVLQASILSYEKAGQPGRKDQVLKLLARVREERELALSLAEIFLAPDIVSASMAFTSPTPKNETAVGLDRFDHADLQVTFIVSPKELHVGQELSLEIVLVNAGRGAAQLTKVEHVIPAEFDVIRKPENYRIEDGVLNLRGRTLDALKTEDLKLVLKPTAKGSYRLKPRILYLDDSGANRTCEPTPIEIVVKEMGISGWIRGT